MTPYARKTLIEYLRWLLAGAALALLACASPTGPVEPKCINTLPNPETGKDSAYVVPCRSASTALAGKGKG